MKTEDTKPKKSLSIQAKLWIAVISTAVGMAMTGSLGVIGMQRASKTVSYLGDSKLQALLLTGQMQVALFKLRDVNKEIAKYENDWNSADLFAQFRGDRNDALAEYNDGGEKYAKIPKEAEETDILARLADSVDIWQKGNVQLDALLSNLSKPHTKEEHQELMARYADLMRIQDRWESQVIDAVAGMVNFNRDASVAATKEAVDSISDSQASIFKIGGVLILISIIGGVFIARSITRPLRRMIATITEIEETDDFSRRVPIQAHDEIGTTIIAFNSMIAKIEERSAQLRQKTNDIQTMMQNMPQGILTITHGSIIHPEYSAYMETIFETKNIAGRDMMDLVFSNTDLGADALSQVEAVGGACIGEDLMNFEFNQHLMAGVVEKRMPDGRVKILDLNWSPITDGNDTIVRLMLCVRDVTELRKLAAEAGEQKKELEMIGEILAVQQEKFHEFIISSLKFIDENEMILRENPDFNADAVTQLFRNMHTIKGNARTYGLNHLTNVVHESEQTYEELRKPHPDLAWDEVALLDELASVRTAVERYARINEVNLGRRGPGRRGNTERYLMVDKDQLQESLHRLETVNTANIHELVAARDSVRKALRLIGTEKLNETLVGVIDSMPSLAAELGKAAPNIVVEDNGYVVRNQASGLLKNVFMHLMRNSMDHGLEAPDARAALHKPAAGTIRLRMNAGDGMMQIALSDDGRGLALARILRMAEEKGLLAAGAQVSDEEIAHQIFRAGFSTADKVTEVSGRGVGMDAVLDFVKRENGKIEIRFTDSAKGADFRQFETIVYLPDSFTEHVES
ncbi:MAG: HAMP domain-containing protein [Burkholderiales bacterium]